MKGHSTLEYPNIPLTSGRPKTAFGPPSREGRSRNSFNDKGLRQPPDHFLAKNPNGTLTKMNKTLTENPHQWSPMFD